jgi:hypothetical protein
MSSPKGLAIYAFAGFHAGEFAPCDWVHGQGIRGRYRRLPREGILLSRPVRRYLFGLTIPSAFPAHHGAAVFPMTYDWRRLSPTGLGTATAGADSQACACEKAQSLEAPPAAGSRLYTGDAFGYPSRTQWYATEGDCRRPGGGHDGEEQ